MGRIHIFEKFDENDQALHNAAVLLVLKYEQIILELNKLRKEGRGALCWARISEEYTKSFLSVLWIYLKNFKFWKIPDELRLTCRVRKSLLAHYDAYNEAKALEKEEDEEGMRRAQVGRASALAVKIENMRAKLQDLGGLEELAKFDEMNNENPNIYCPWFLGEAGAKSLIVPWRLVSVM